MNEFLSCTKKDKSVEEYHEEFVKLSRHAPLMFEEQKLSRFILGLGGQLTDEVESLRPASLAGRCFNQSQIQDEKLYSR